MTQNDIFNDAIHSFNTSYWELCTQSYEEVWSENFYKTLGYIKEELHFSIDYFLDHLIHEEDADIFKDNFFNYCKNDVDFKQHLQILNKNGQYQLFKCVTNNELPPELTPERHYIFFFEILLDPGQAITQDNFYFKETAQMTATGSWYVDFVKKQSYWDFETKKILEYPDDYIPSLRNSAQYYPEDCREQAASLFFRCAMNGTPFNTEIKMITANERVFWARAIGKPIYNKKKEIVGIRGVFQDIDEVKRKELQLKKSLNTITSQNSRLLNFAHIVSHNLRSHTSNLSLLVQLIEDIKDPEEKNSLIHEIRNISESLNTTIAHLNEIVAIQNNKHQEKKKVNFIDTYDVVMNGIKHLIAEHNAEIYTDFSQLDGVSFLPAYLESVFLNLITNAIKYRHPDRNPVIKIKSFLDEGNMSLEFTDNGSGIDLHKAGDKLFGMYKTFHDHKDAVGIGLFLTKNQIEAMDGRINVESIVGKGTTFIIEF
ncbi:PAS domain-containing protein [Aquimarina hainanensis]|uniref:histidine kinase n=1 Tax=Aquimarina hainanensis TaxID=1578017 RepID=A0ABW5N2A8_9FLAO|nr:PAS domain-containing sensor histidine kinase [Aquimarina sp. TRL1]QKX04636.1 PAS domain-containing protein [Aquimarina sp. TRL1]